MITLSITTPRYGYILNVIPKMVRTWNICPPTFPISSIITVIYNWNMDILSICSVDDCVVAYISIHSFLLIIFHCMFILLTCWWTLQLFMTLGFCESYCYTHWYTTMCQVPAFNSLGVLPGVKLQGIWLILCLVLKELPNYKTL
jgi:hypothetical protein